MERFEELASTGQKVALGLVLVVLPLGVATLIYGLWPIEIIKDGKGTDIYQSFFLTEWNPDLDRRFILIVMLTGALGSYVHAATSFVSFVGNDRLGKTWMWWYLLRPLIGASLALLFYFVVRGGLLTANGGAKDISVFGLAAVAGLVGMFSKQATDKLRETFDTLFRTVSGDGDDARRGKLASNAPAVWSVTPSQLPQGTSNLTITITGGNFVRNSSVEIGGSKRVTRYVSATELQADLVSGDVANAGIIRFLVRNPDEQGGAGQGVSISII